MTKEQKEFGYDGFICLEVYTKTQYFLNPNEWEEVKHNFGYYSHKQVSQILTNEEYLKDNVPDLFYGDYDTLIVLKNFIYGGEK